MTTQTQSGWRRFFNLKTDSQLDAATRAADVKARTIATPHGLRSFIGDKQKSVDDLAARTNSFLADIETYFGDAAKYLNPEYTGRSKFENIERSDGRRIGVRWVDRAYPGDDCVITDITFSYVETPKGAIRVDFILTSVSGGKKVVNDNYNERDDDIYKDQYDVVDSYRNVRRYADHDAFATSGDKPPKWFIDRLSLRTPLTP